MRKRTWCYCQQPTCYEITCDLCGGLNITWSEFCHKIWCYDCKKDTDGTGGIFDGPIPTEVAEMMGIFFDRIDIKTGKLRKMMVTKTGKLIWKKWRVSGENQLE